VLNDQLLSRSPGYLADGCLARTPDGKLDLGRIDQELDRAFSAAKAARPTPARQPEPPANPAPEVRAVAVLPSETGAVHSLSLSQDGRLLLAGIQGGSVELWDVKSQARAWQLRGHTNTAFGVSITGDGAWGLSGSSDNDIRLWNLAAGRCHAVLQGHTGPVQKVLFLRGQNQTALSASWDGTVRLWDLGSRRCLRVLEGHTDSVLALGAAPDGRLALSGGGEEDHSIRLWDLSNGTCLKTLRGHRDRVRAVSVSGDGRFALSAGDDRQVKFWDLESGECLRNLRGHEDWIQDVCLDTLARRALSVSDDRTLWFWDLTAFACVRTIREHTGNVLALEVNRDWSRVVTAGRDGTIRVWALDWTIPPEVARPGTRRPVSAEQGTPREAPAPPAALPMKREEPAAAWQEFAQAWQLDLQPGESVVFRSAATKRWALWSHSDCQVIVTSQRLVFKDREDHKHSFEIPAGKLRGARFTTKWDTDLVIHTSDGKQWEIGLGASRVRRELEQRIQDLAQAAQAAGAPPPLTQTATIPIQCPNPQCGNQAQAPAQFAGRKVKCNRCGTVITVPGNP
jgi:hypothetical protein